MTFTKGTAKVKGASLKRLILLFYFSRLKPMDAPVAGARAGTLP